MPGDLSQGSSLFSFFARRGRNSSDKALKRQAAPNSSSSLILSKTQESDEVHEHNDIIAIEQMKKLELALSKKHFYQIIVHVVGKDSENLIRFLTAFEDWKTLKSKRERKQKGRKIVSMFISRGSQYEISGVPEWNMKDMISSEFNESSSELAKEFALRQLIKDPIVMSTLDFEFLSSQEGENDDCRSRGSNSRESIDDWNQKEMSESMMQLEKRDEP